MNRSNNRGHAPIPTGAKRPWESACLIGLGNVLLGDDGFGPLAIEMFRCAYECGPNIEILDLGTPGLDLAPYLYGANLVVIADAVLAEGKPGTLCTYCEADLLSCRARLRLTAHDPGVQESLAQLRLMDRAPSELIIVGCVPESCELGKNVSPSVWSASSVAADSMARLLMERDVNCRRRRVPLQPNLWWLPRDRCELVASR
ncbi:MAG TPA: hydrogenase maturation protease [Candidatus Sulfotelmatobacter sp.]|nr:hydrogenase maturation protease [Candidatus Sulfotelmatobacter sp.]